MGEITKQDLIDSEDRATKRIIEHIDLKLAPIKEDVDELKVATFGKGNDNGLKIDVTILKNSAKWVKGLAGGGVVAGMSSWFTKLFGS